MKKTVESIGIFILQAYLFISFIIFTPYYNYEYAKENGFGKWLVLGQIVPTAKAFAWPYYRFSMNGKNTDIDIQKDEQICASIINESESDKENAVSTTQDIYDFNKHIKSYPKEYIDTLKELVKIIFLRTNLQNRDLIRWFCTSNEFGRRPKFKISDSMRILDMKLLRVYHINDTSQEYETVVYVNTTDTTSLDSTVAADRIIQMKTIYIPMVMRNQDDFYNKLFNKL